MDHQIRPITDSEVDAFRVEMANTFGEDLSDEERADDTRFREVMPLARTRAAFDGDEIVGTLGDFAMDVTVPGGASVPMAGTTMVTVRPTHTRRGILRAMMTSHLSAARAERRPLAGLWASASTIYGRYGYGSSVNRLVLELPASAAAIPTQPIPNTVRQVDVSEALAVFAPVYETARTTTAGLLSRTPTDWKWKLADPVHQRAGRSAQRLVVSDAGSGPEGYAIYRLKEDWDDAVPRGQVHITEIQAVTPRASAALWRYLTSIDLFPQVSWWNCPVDEELVWRVTEPRSLKRTIQDSLWIRVLDIPSALGARRYGTDGSITFTVEDAFFPDLAGTYRLEGGPRGAACSRSDGPSELQFEVAALGAIYMGGNRVSQLARAGLVEGEPAAIRLADAMFSWDREPWCPVVF